MKNYERLFTAKFQSMVGVNTGYLSGNKPKIVL